MNCNTNTYRLFITLHKKLLQWFLLFDIIYSFIAVPGALVLPIRNQASISSYALGFVLLLIGCIIYNALGYERYLGSLRFYFMLPFSRGNLYSFFQLIPVFLFVISISVVTGVWLLIVPAISFVKEISHEHLWWVMIFGIFSKIMALPLLMVSKKHPLFLLFYILVPVFVALGISIVYELCFQWNSYPLPFLAILYLGVLFLLNTTILKKMAVL